MASSLEGGGGGSGDLSGSPTELGSITDLLPGIERARGLRELYLSGGGAGAIERAAGWAEDLFGLLPRLEKVCLPAAGWSRARRCGAGQGAAEGRTCSGSALVAT